MFDLRRKGRDLHWSIHKIGLPILNQPEQIEDYKRVGQMHRLNCKQKLQNEK
jgi:hypothetical protein